MVFLLLVCTGSDAHQSLGELVLLNRQSKKHNQQKVKCFLSAVKVEPVHQESHTGNWHRERKRNGRRRKKEEHPLPQP